MGNANDTAINVACALNEYFNNYHVNYIKYDLKIHIMSQQYRKKLYNTCNQDNISSN